MERPLTDQIFESLRKASKILVALPHELNSDISAAGLGLSLFLQKLSKEITLASASDMPKRLDFLPRAVPRVRKLDTSKDLVVVLNTKDRQLQELSYRSFENSVDIYLKAKEGTFSPEDISFGNSQTPFDLIITLGCTSLEALGDLFKNHAEVFYETPKINIDYHGGNEHFGAINLVDMTATSVSEILASVLTKFEEEVIDEDIATCLLSGIIANTNSFQHVHTTPNALLASANLINLGGRQQDIIKHLFKTKPLPLLQLWGRALARIKTLKDNSLIYSVLTLADFERSGADKEDVSAVLSEMLDNVSGYRAVALLVEVEPGSTRLLLALHPPLNFEALRDIGSPTAAPVPVQGLYQMAAYELGPLGEAESRLLAAAQKLPK